MENEENTKITVNGKQYYNLEEVPEALRAMIQAKLDAAKTGTGTEPSGAGKINFQKDFQFKFQGGSGMAALLKLLVTMAQPPKIRIPAPPTSPDSPQEREEKPFRTDFTYAPDAIKPTSSLWIILLAAAAGAIIYFFYLRTR